MKGYEKIYTLVHDGHKKILCLMKEILPLKRPLKKLIPYKQEDSSNILVEKQVETYIHTHILYRVLASIDCRKYCIIKHQFIATEDIYLWEYLCPR